MYRRTGGQPKPSISICPNCHQQKDPNSALCLNCNTRSCANGHIMSPAQAVCSKCGWTDHHWKAPQKSQVGTPPITYDHDEVTHGTATASDGRCPLCGSRLDPKSAYCPACGNLVNAEADFSREDFNTPAPPRMQTPATPPPRVESYTVTQEVIGHKDKRRNYYCPRCKNKIDDPRPGRCPHCGYVGTSRNGHRINNQFIVRSPGNNPRHSRNLHRYRSLKKPVPVRIAGLPIRQIPVFAVPAVRDTV